MESKDLKKVIGEVAKRNCFKLVNSNWVKESEETIMVLNLQKSNFSNKYYLNIRVFIKGLFDKFIKIDKTVLKNDTGDVFRRTPPEFDPVLDLENDIELSLRIEEIEKLFNSFIIPFSYDALSIKGLLDLYRRNQINLLPAVKDALEKFK